MVSNAQDEYYFSTELYSRERESTVTGILTHKEKAKCRGCKRERSNTTVLLAGLSSRGTVYGKKEQMLTEKGARELSQSMLSSQRFG